MIEFVSLSKSFGPAPVLNFIQSHFDPHQIHVVLGPSGSGKSTLLKIILGLISPDSGQIKVNDEPLTRANRKTWPHQMGYVSAADDLLPHLTVEENIYFLARLLNHSSNTSTNQFNQLREIINFDLALLKKNIKPLNPKQRYETRLMRALMHDPPILLMDEPFRILDPLERSQLRLKLKNVTSSLKKTVVFATAHWEDAFHLADQVHFLHEGSIVQTGSPQDILGRPVNSFVGDFIQAQSISLSLENAP